MSLGTTVARLIMNFDIGFAPEDGDDRGRKFEAGTKDHFTLGLTELKMCLKKRQYANELTPACPEFLSHVYITFLQFIFSK